MKNFTCHFCIKRDNSIATMTNNTTSMVNFLWQINSTSSERLPSLVEEKFLKNMKRDVKRDLESRTVDELPEHQ